MIKEINISQLATAVMWWLNYTSSMGRNYVLSESAIKFPVAEYLERSTVDNIELEFGHPKLSMKRIDLFFKNGLDENCVFEFKYIKNGSTRTTNEKQRVFNDLMRLYLYLEVSHKSYFLICGDQFEFTSNFESLLLKPTDTEDGSYIKPKVQSSTSTNIQPKGFYTEWFSFNSNNSGLIIDLTTDKADYKSIYERFEHDYKESYKANTGNTLQLPDNIKTNLIFLSENLKQPNGLFQPSKIGIWEVLKTT